MQRRENTFRIDNAKIPKKPTFEELHQFVSSILGMKREEVVRLQCSRYLGCAFVKASSLEIAERVVQEHDGKHEMEIDKKMYPLRLCLEDGGVDVKLHDLSEDVHNECISAYMQQYGEILSIRELSWDSKYAFGDISTGIRVVRMVVKKNVPSIVTIDGESTWVSYSGQLQTCRHCNGLTHNGVTCIQNKKLLLQKLHADKTSYASVTKQTESNKNNSKRVQSRAPRETGSPPEQSQASHKRSLSTSSTTSTPNTTTTSGSMPPPPLPNPTLLITTPRLETEFPTLLKSPAHMAAAGHNQHRPDGHESDSSSTSNSSRRLRHRLPGKKMRQDYNDNTNNPQ